MRAVLIMIGVLGSQLPAAGQVVASPRAGEFDDRNTPSEPRRGAVDDGVDLGVDGSASPRVRVRGPAIAAVLSAAYGAAGLDRDPTRGWIRRARLAGLVPSVTVRTGRNMSWQDNDSDIDHGMALEVRATWRLDRLVFDGRELQVASIEAARRRERQRLASRVIRTYFAWRRAVELDAIQPGSVSRANETAAELDALTDGWFSDALGASRRSASDTRTD